MISITVSTTINASVDMVWKAWNTPDEITKWYFASDDWHCPKAENELRMGGEFVFRMEVKDGSFGFDFNGRYDEIILNEYICYSLLDGRRVRITFTDNGDSTTVSETFDAETENPIEMQRMGWQMILDNFKKHVEAN